MRRTVSMVTEPNVVPMIDVLLVLLVIFMLSAVRLMRKAFDLYLPTPAQGESGPPPLVLTVSPGPRYEVNGRALSGDLERELRALFEGRRERILYIRGDAKMPYQQVIQAFDAARGAGVAVTAVMPGSAPPTAPPRVP